VVCHSTNDNNSTERNGISSPLLRLPGKLRNKIYEYALGGRVWHVGDRGSDTRPGDQLIVIKASEVPDACSLLRACHQIHAEAHHLPLSLITYSSDTAWYLRDWFENRGSHMVSAATQLSLRISHFYGWFDPGYSPFEVLWWQDEDLCFTDLPSLKSIELVVDLSAWMTA
jgi:hypothetical protein